MTPPAAGADVRVVLLAGGKGTRFWPASREARPKQFLRLLGDRTLLRLTFERFARIVSPDRIHVVTNGRHAARTRDELPELPEGNLLLEPSGRDTAPAASLAARELGRLGGDPVLLVAPTDHYVQDESAFGDAIHAGIAEAQRGSLVTFGVVPDRPATVYGYIEVRDIAARPSSGGVLQVLRFREKPGAEEAARFFETGRFYWNAGIFAWRIGVFQAELVRTAPALAAGIAGLPPLGGADAAAAERFSRAWESLPSTSVDYALMEKASRVVCVPLAAGWSDVGNWDAVRELSRQDDAGNLAAQDVLYVGARACAVHRCEGEVGKAGGAVAKRFYALVRTENLIVVESPDAVLICPADAGEALRAVVRELEAAGRKDLL